MKSEKWLPPSILAGAVAGLLAMNGLPFISSPEAESVPAIAEPVAEATEEAAPPPTGAEPVAGSEGYLPKAGSAPPAGDSPILFEEQVQSYKDGHAEEVRSNSLWTPDVVMRSVVSMMVMIASFFVLLSKAYGADTTKWAVGALAVVVGYWL